jgi:ketosteroid isomerase-like protein
MADGGRRQVQTLRRAADVPLGEHHVEEREQIQVGATKIYLIQHLAEIVSLDSSRTAPEDHDPDRRWLRFPPPKESFIMSTSRRTLLGAAAAGLALDAAHAQAAASSGQQAAELARISEEANDALMRGDISRYLSLVKLAPDFTLMSPFGGTPSRGSHYTPERIEAMGRFFRNGSLRQEVVQAYATADMVALAVIERAHVEVGGLPAQDWNLRVTLVYRRDGTTWHLVHRHADPLAPGIDLKQASDLARGTREHAQAARQ